jgi:hypothetical protein
MATASAAKPTGRCCGVTSDPPVGCVGTRGPMRAGPKRFSRRGRLCLEVRCERLPGWSVAAPDVAGQDGTAFVEDGDGRVSVKSERTGELGARVGERRPRPAVLA